MTYEEFKTKYAGGLNPQQEQAVCAVDGNLLLLAVPGSGKTTVLVTRLGYLRLCRNIPSEQIMTMTYTVAAARDMRKRFESIFGVEAAEGMRFRTINGVCASIIHAFERMSGRRAFQLITEERDLSAIVAAELTRVREEYASESEVSQIRTAITYAKNRMLNDAQITELDREIRDFSEIYAAYCKILRERGWMDYDDQMVYALRILKRYPEILTRFRAMCRYTCVDEAQDTSKIQHEIIDLLSAEGNLFLVGDEDQSIYGFRAAYPEALTQFEARHPGGRVLLMETNYRSTSGIVEAAGSFIAKNKQRRSKRMIADRARDVVKTPVREIPLYNRKSQYPYLLKVAQAVAAGEAGETAVLFRDNECALPLIDLLERNNVPYHSRKLGGSFFTHRVVRDLSDIIRFASDPANGELFLRIYYKFGAGISRRAAENAIRVSGGNAPLLEVLAYSEEVSRWTQIQCKALSTHCAGLRDERADKAVFRIVRFMGYGDYLDERTEDLNKARILEILGEQEATPMALLDRLAELDRITRREEDGAGPESRFILSTVHSSKGLEYDRVFLMDVLDGIFPKLGMPWMDREALERLEEEERRIFYVGMTRARDQVGVFTFAREEAGSEFSDALFSGKERPKKAEKPKKKQK